MKRREFLKRSAGAALLGAVPVGVAAAARGPLLDDPQAWIGARFGLADGSLLELARVEPVAFDAASSQWRLQFRVLAGAAPREGLHALACGLGGEELFLQAGREGPVACVNRLHRMA